MHSLKHSYDNTENRNDKYSKININSLNLFIGGKLSFVAQLTIRLLVVLYNTSQQKQTHRKITRKYKPTGCNSSLSSVLEQQHLSTVSIVKYKNFFNQKRKNNK